MDNESRGWVLSQKLSMWEWYVATWKVFNNTFSQGFVRWFSLKCDFRMKKNIGVYPDKKAWFLGPPWYIILSVGVRSEHSKFTKRGRNYTLIVHPPSLYKLKFSLGISMSLILHSIKVYAHADVWYKKFISRHKGILFDWYYLLWGVEMEVVGRSYSYLCLMEVVGRS